MCKFNKSCFFVNEINSFNGFQVSSWMKLLFNTLEFIDKKFVSFPRLKVHLYFPVNRLTTLNVCLKIGRLIWPSVIKHGLVDKCLCQKEI